jgi:hypothetical protein
MVPIMRGTIVRLRLDKTAINTVGLVCEEKIYAQFIGRMGKLRRY